MGEVRRPVKTRKTAARLVDESRRLRAEAGLVIEESRRLRRGIAERRQQPADPLRRAA